MHIRWSRLIRSTHGLAGRRGICLPPAIAEQKYHRSLGEAFTGLVQTGPKKRRLSPGQQARGDLAAKR